MKRKPPLKRPLHVAFIAPAPIFRICAPRRHHRRCTTLMTRTTPEEEMLVRRAVENSRRAVLHASSFERDGEFEYAPNTSLGLELVRKDGTTAPAAEDYGGQFVVASDSTATFALDGLIRRVSDTLSKETPTTETEPVVVENEVRVGIPMNNAMEGARFMRDGVMRLVKESTMTGSLRLPTGPETALFAWEATMVIALVLLLRAGVSSTLRWIHTRLRASVAYEESVWECMQRPLETVSVFTVATLLAEAVTRPLAAAGLLRYLRTLRELGFIVCATWFLIRWIDRIRSRFAADKRIDKAQVDATSRIATVATTAVSVLVSLDTVGINVQTVLAFGGIGGVAIGFAGREIISNFFGGFMIYVTRPFTVGEWIRSIEEEELNGTVEDIGWYLTRVRTWDKRPLYIPNSRFSTLIVENGSRMANRRILHTLRLRHEDVPVLPKIVAELTKMLMAHSELDPRQHRMAYVDGFGEYSVMVWLSCYTKSVFLYDFRRVQQEILLHAHDIIRMYGARLATVNTRDMRPGVDTDRYGPYGDKASYRTPSDEPKVGETPEPQRFKLSDIPGAPFFSRLHVEDMVNNIESGVSEESIAAALRMESATPLPTQSHTVESDKNRQSTSEAAVAAAAAALAAARRNQARIEENNETRGRDNVNTTGGGTVDNGEMKITSVPKVTTNASKGDGKMKISAVSKSTDSTASGGGETGSRATIKEGDGQMKISAVPKATVDTNAANRTTTSSVKGDGKMKISAVTTRNVENEASDKAGNISPPPPPVKDVEAQMRISVASKVTESDMGSIGAGNSNRGSTMNEGDGKMKISAVSRQNDNSTSTVVKNQGMDDDIKISKVSSASNAQVNDDDRKKSKVSSASNAQAKDDDRKKSKVSSASNALVKNDDKKKSKVSSASNAQVNDDDKKKSKVSSDFVDNTTADTTRVTAAVPKDGSNVPSVANRGVAAQTKDGVKISAGSRVSDDHEIKFTAVFRLDSPPSPPSKSPSKKKNSDVEDSGTMKISGVSQTPTTSPPPSVSSSSSDGEKKRGVDSLSDGSGTKG